MPRLPQFNITASNAKTNPNQITASKARTSPDSQLQNQRPVLVQFPNYSIKGQDQSEFQITVSKARTSPKSKLHHQNEDLSKFQITESKARTRLNSKLQHQMLGLVQIPNYRIKCQAWYKSQITAWKGQYQSRIQITDQSKFQVTAINAMTVPILNYSIKFEAWAHLFRINDVIFKSWYMYFFVKKCEEL